MSKEDVTESVKRLQEKGLIKKKMINDGDRRKDEENYISENTMLIPNPIIVITGHLLKSLKIPQKEFEIIDDKIHDAIPTKYLQRGFNNEYLKRVAMFMDDEKS